MARETKLGMLVGLGFIICFAIILENRGRRDQVSPQMPHEMLAQTGSDVTTVSPAVVEGRVRNYTEQVRNRNQRPEAVPRREIAQLRNDAAPADIETETPILPTLARDFGEGHLNGRRSLGGEPATRLANSGVESVDTGLRDRTADRATTSVGHAKTLAEPPPQDTRFVPARSEAEVSLSASVSGSGQPSVANSPKQVPPKEKKSLPSQMYTVQKSDSLYAIAKRFYGRPSKHVVDAIFDANRSSMSSPNDIRVGQKIALPGLQGQLKSNPTATPKPTAKEATPKKSNALKPPAAGKKYRYYQIKKGDRYATIARDQLGDASRWKEIADINLDKFPDASKIRYGVRIRLPLDAPSTRKTSMPS